MPVDTPHEEYTNHQLRWQKCRDVVDGEKAVKERGREYLPFLSGQETDEYLAYKVRALFYNATQRTVKGLTGAVFRKEPIIEFPESKLELLDAIASDAKSFNLIAQEAVEEVLTLGRFGLLVDATADDGVDAQVTTGQDPFIAVYYCENIINWRTTRIDNEQVLTMVVLQEKFYEIEGDDEFVQECRTRFRVLKLNVSAQTPIYSQELYVVDEDKLAELQSKNQDGSKTIDTPYKLDQTIVPTKKGGATLQRIPFWILTPRGIGTKIEKSPVEDLVDVNLSHYRTSADLEHGRHFTSLPTPWTAGFKAAGGSLTIGSERAWVSEDPTAKCGMLEFTGKGLESLSSALDQKENMMSILGARMLEEPKADAEATDTLKIRVAGENASLGTIATVCSEGLTKCLQAFADWMGFGTPEISVQLNKDFFGLSLSPAMLQALLLQWQGNGMSWDVYFYNLRRAGMYPDGWTQEDEEKKIQGGGPIPLPGNDPDAEGTTGTVDTSSGVENTGDPTKPPPVASPQKSIPVGRAGVGSATGGFGD